MHRDDNSCIPARRRLLQGLVSVPLVWAARHAAAFNVGDVVQSPRVITLINTHTSESLVAEYFTAGHYVPAVLGRLDMLLRDHRSGEAHSIEPRLFDVLHQLADMAGVDPVFEVISGYRSPATNDKLHSAGGGVAKNSLHIQGKAIDVRLRGVNCKRLRDLALDLGDGGVGYYARSSFVHLDTGRVRSWSG
jgi:uncharacterized protein YcbK (DUF882 family)